MQLGFKFSSFVNRDCLPADRGCAPVVLELLVDVHEAGIGLRVAGGTSHFSCLVSEGGLEPILT